MTEKAILYKNGSFRKFKSCLMCGCSQDVETLSCGIFKICGELWMLLDCECTDKRILIKDSDKILDNCPLTEPDYVRLLVELSEPGKLSKAPIIPDGPIEFIQAGIPWIKIEEDTVLPERHKQCFVRFEYIGAPDSKKIYSKFTKAHIGHNDLWQDKADDIYLMDATVTHYAVITEPEGLNEMD